MSGFLKGPVTARRYRVVGDLPPDFLSVAESRVSAYAARSPALDGTSEVVTYGFAMPDNLLDTEFSDVSRWISDEYIFLAFRTDKLEMPKREIKARTEQAIRRWVSENQVERAPAAIRRQIKENVILELRSKNRIKMTNTEFVWNMKEQFVYFASTSDSANEQFRKTFFRAFGVKIIAVELAARYEVKDGIPEPVTTYPPTDLLQWILWTSTVREGAIGDSDQEFGLFTGDRILFAAPSDASTKIAVKADNASEAPESSRAILEGRVVEEIGITITSAGEDIGSVTFKGGLPDLTRAKSIAEGEASDAVHRVATMMIYEGLVSQVEKVVEAFLKTREDPTAWAKVGSELHEWAAQRG